MQPILKLADDGSLTLCVQNEAPTNDKKTNWLPVPEGKFMMFLGTYWPKASVLNSI